MVRQRSYSPSVFFRLTYFISWLVAKSLRTMLLLGLDTILWDIFYSCSPKKSRLIIKLYFYLMKHWELVFTRCLYVGVVYLFLADWILRPLRNFSYCSFYFTISNGSVWILRMGLILCLLELSIAPIIFLYSISMGG